MDEQSGDPNAPKLIVRRRFQARPRRWWLAAVLAVGLLAAIVVDACGSGGGTDTVAISPAQLAGIKQTGPGLTEPTAPAGARIKGGTVTFAEAPGAAPNNIFPMYSPQYCAPSNTSQLQDLLYRPLYWYGNDYSPTVDYDYSLARRPSFSDGGTTVTIRLKHYMWSNGTPVTSRDIVFWMNLLRANPNGFCGHIGGKFPDNVTSYSAPSPSTFVLHFNRAYNHTWLLYNELSQITPLPIAWDRTSPKGATPTAATKNLPDTSRSGAVAVYNFLNSQGIERSSWASSPLWQVVDGPWTVQSTTGAGGVTFVPNMKYTGPVKASIARFVEVPVSSDAELLGDLEQADKTKGHGARTEPLTIAYLPSGHRSAEPRLAAKGYELNLASSYGFNYFPLNLANPTIGKVFSQLYFRQAFQHLVDQPGWIRVLLGHAAIESLSSIPTAPPSTLLGGVRQSSGPFAFSVPAAVRQLAAHGWKVVPGGITHCIRPGTGAGDCGAGVKAGQKLAFTLQYAAGNTALAKEMADLQAQAKRAGIEIALTESSFGAVYASAVSCTPRQPSCSWTAENWGTGWSYGPDYFPTGDTLFATGAVSNSSNYSNAEMDRLIGNTIAGSSAHEYADMNAFARYLQQQLPVVFVPTPVGTFVSGSGTLISKRLGGYSAQAFGWLTPEQWYLTK